MTQLLCNALIVELPKGRIRLSALISNEMSLTNSQKDILKKIGVKMSTEYDERYELEIPKDKIDLIVIKR